MTDTKELVERVRYAVGESRLTPNEYEGALAALSELEERLDEKDDAIDGLRRQSSEQADEAILWRKRAEAAERERDAAQAAVRLEHQSRIEHQARVAELEEALRSLDAEGWFAAWSDDPRVIAIRAALDGAKS